MPGKSKRGKGKRFKQYRKNQPAQRQPDATPQTQPVSNTPRPVTPVAPSAITKPVVNTATLTTQSAYIVGELKRIGILTGIIVIVLIILVIVLT